MSAVITRTTSCVLNRPALMLSSDGQEITVVWIRSEKDGGLPTTLDELKRTAVRIGVANTCDEVEVKI